MKKQSAGSIRQCKVLALNGIDVKILSKTLQAINFPSTLIPNIKKKDEPSHEERLRLKKKKKEINFCFITPKKLELYDSEVNQTSLYCIL